jgi:hypothetical protein
VSKKPIPTSSAAARVSLKRTWSDGSAFHRLVPIPSAGTLIPDLPSGRSVPDSFIGARLCVVGVWRHSRHSRLLQTGEGMAGLADRPRCGRPALGGRRLTRRITALLGRPGPWTLPRIRRYLGWPQLSPRTLYRRVRLVTVWRRPKLTARGDPDHDHVVAGITARLLELPRRAVVLAEDETHLNLLPHVRASWTLRGRRPEVPTPGKNRRVTVFGALEVTTGAWAYRLGRRCAADFIALLDQLLTAFPGAPSGSGRR